MKLAILRSTDHQDLFTIIHTRRAKNGVLFEISIFDERNYETLIANKIYDPLTIVNTMHEPLMQNYRI